MSQICDMNYIPNIGADVIIIKNNDKGKIE